MKIREAIETLENNPDSLIDYNEIYKETKLIEIEAEKLKKINEEYGILDNYAKKIEFDIKIFEYMLIVGFKKETLEKEIESIKKQIKKFDEMFTSYKEKLKISLPKH